MDKKELVGHLVKAIGVSVETAYNVDGVKRDGYNVVNLLDVSLYPYTMLRLIVKNYGVKDNEIVFITGTGEGRGVSVNNTIYNDPGRRVVMMDGRVEVLVGGNGTT